MINSEFRKKMADSWFSYLQAQICKSFENLEGNKLKFSKRDWYKKNIIISLSLKKMIYYCLAEKVQECQSICIKL